MRIFLAALLMYAFINNSFLFGQETKLPENYKATNTMTQEEQAHFKGIAGKLRCPTCTGLSVLDSDAPFSLQIQALVKEQIAKGNDDQAILQYFTDRYGPWILREPPKEGINLLAWIFPLALMLGGPLLIWFFVWRRRPMISGGRVRSRSEIIGEFEQALSLARANTKRGS